ncbi:MAG: hypothetical protein AAF311_06975, partial [Pseudomonadota bacterium]
MVFTAKVFTAEAKARGSPSRDLLFWVETKFLSELFDIVNIGKRDAGGVWRRADLVTDRTLVMTYVTTFLFMKLRSLGR